MSDEIDGDAAVAGKAASGVGAQLRAAREALGLSLAQVAAQTRIGLTSLERIEAGEFHLLPGRIYATGFAKTYAKVVGLDPNDVAEMVRFELGADPEVRALRPEFAPGDPTRAPSGRLVWFSLIAVVLLLIGLFFAAKVLMDPAAELPSLTEQQEAEQAAAASAQTAQAAQAAQPVNAGGAVVLTAEQEVWLRVTDAADQRLMEGELAAGQTYTVPADATGPKLMTGRPNALAITVGGRAVPKISEELRTVVDVPVDAASLLARAAPAGQANPTGTPTSAATPAPTGTASPTFRPTSSPRSPATVD
jgi:cytoskeleton protein RodZ